MGIPSHNALTLVIGEWSLPTHFHVTSAAVLPQSPAHTFIHIQFIQRRFVSIGPAEREGSAFFFGFFLCYRSSAIEIQ